MGMYRVVKHIKNNCRYEKLELGFMLNKSIYNNRCLGFRYRYKAYKRRSSVFFGASRLRNFCMFSGRDKGVFKSHGLSRIEMRTMFNNGLWFGVGKSSW